MGVMLEVALRRSPEPQGPGPTGVGTHQLLLAVLGAAQDGRGRRGVARELADAWRHAGAYAGSTEELSPVRHDWRAAVPVAAATLATMIRPSLWQELARASVANYALTPEGWSDLRAHRGEQSLPGTGADPAPPPPRPTSSPPQGPITSAELSPNR